MKIITPVYQVHISCFSDLIDCGKLVMKVYFPRPLTFFSSYVRFHCLQKSEILQNNVKEGFPFYLVVEKFY